MPVADGAGTSRVAYQRVGIIGAGVIGRAIEAAHPDVVVRPGAERLAKGDLRAFHSSAPADA